MLMGWCSVSSIHIIDWEYKDEEDKKEDFWFSQLTNNESDALSFGHCMQFIHYFTN
jgi:hypothetical protein